MKLKIDTLERERDFYFDKLRDIEILCQTQELASLPVPPLPSTTFGHPLAHIYKLRNCHCR